MKVKNRVNLSAAEKAARATLTYTTTAMDLGEKPEAPTEFRIFKAGINTSDKGDFLFDDKAAAAVMAAYAKKAQTLTMDYEHQALADPPVKAIASCSSWVPEVRNGELWATQCKWTDDAAREIVERKYTRFSPAFLHDPKTMRVLRILNVALTNLEALDGVDLLIAASIATHGEQHMKTMACAKCTTALKTPTDDNDGDEAYCKTCSSASMTKASLLSLVGLKATQPEAEIAVELSAIASFGTEIMALTGKSVRAEAIGVLMGWKANAAEVATLRAEKATSEDARIKTEFDAALNGAIAGGKVPPAEKEALIAIFGKPTAESLAKLTAYLGARGVTVNVDATKQKTTGSGLLTAEDIAVAKMLGNSIEDVQKFKAAQLSAAR